MGSLFKFIDILYQDVKIRMSPQLLGSKSVTNFTHRMLAQSNASFFLIIYYFNFDSTKNNSHLLLKYLALSRAI
jgi:hypothetical protein